MPVLRPTRRIHIRLRGRVLCNPPRLKGFRSARPYETAVLFQNLVSVGFPLGLWPRPSKRYAFFGGYPARNKAAQCTLGSWVKTTHTRRSLRGKARLLPRAASTVCSAILRRRNTASLSRARPVAHHANAASCDRLRGSAFGLGQPDRFATGACRRAVPLRLLLTHPPLARPSAMARFSS